MIVPGGGISPDGLRWIPCRRGFFLPVRVLSKLFRRLMLEKLDVAYKAGKLQFAGRLAHLAGAAAFAAFLKPLRDTKWFVYSKRPFSGPKTVLAYLSRYTHRIAISNRRLVAADKTSVTFKYKDYRVKGPGDASASPVLSGKRGASGAGRYKTMTLGAHEFIRRFLTHVLPKGFHRIRHYGLFSSTARADNLSMMRVLIDLTAPASGRIHASEAPPAAAAPMARICPCCASRMLIIETFEGSCRRRRPVPPPPGIDTS
jgi:hypothetical protein